MEDDQRKEQVKNIIFNFIKDGMLKKEAAKMAGIDESTFYRWMKSDASFASQVEANILEYKYSLIKIVNACAVKDGRIALEVLKRRFPEDAKHDEKREHEANTKEIADLLQKIYDEEDSYEENDRQIKSEDKSKKVSDLFT
ncbi:MAG TPA: hypothetical protein VLG12_02530 [Candidatus Saccharimonadales bacterium]|nr:hypothetical protein [Candidatus Saccharimonadales bacterium]